MNFIDFNENILTSLPGSTHEKFNYPHKHVFIFNFPRKTIWTPWRAWPALKAVNKIIRAFYKFRWENLVLHFLSIHFPDTTSFLCWTKEKQNSLNIFPIQMRQKQLQVEGVNFHNRNYIDHFLRSVFHGVSCFQFPISCSWIRIIIED